MCLVNCTKTLDLIQPMMQVSESELLCELIRAENKLKCEIDATRWPTRRDSSSAKNMEEVDNAKPDFLTVSTQWTRRIFQKIKRSWKKSQNKTSIRILTKTSQPLHVVAVIVTCLLMYAMYPTTTTTSPGPNTFPDSSSSSVGATTVTDSTTPIEATSPQTETPANKFALFGYLSTFAIQFGAQMWMTFVSGLALYFSLPRHIFGQCQRVLFPLYFLMNASLGIVKLFSFCHLLDAKEQIGTAAFVQIVLMGTALLIEAGIYFHLVEPLLNLMQLKHKFEMLVGSGREIGYENQKELKASPAYQKVHKAFRRTHMIIAMGNLTTVACSFAHLYYMVQKINLV